MLTYYRIMFFSFFIFLSSIFLLFSSALRVYYINVGQGDCIYISFPDGKNMLIDGGRDYREENLNPLIYFLKNKEITKINYMLLSHPHADHINGLYAVLKMFNVENIYDTGVDNPAILIDEKFRSLAKKFPERYKIVNSTGHLAGFSVTSVSCTVLYTNTIPQTDLNNNSIVVKIQYLNSTFIFGGDATGGTVEAEIVRLHGTAIKSDCYKVHHHGSKDSSYVAFLNNLQPKYAFIQVGRNDYGHPATETINRIANVIANSTNIPLIDARNRIYRNDLHGTIYVRTSGDGKYSIMTGYIPVPDEYEEFPPGITTVVEPKFVIAEVRNNIFNPEQGRFAYLAYTMTTPGKIYVNIYTIFGELVRSDEFYENRQDLVLESVLPNEIKWHWNGKNLNNQPVAPGVYLVHIQTPIKSEIKKVVVVR